MCECHKYQIGHADKLFRKHLKIYPRYLRPPYGEYNIDITKQLKSWGYELIIMWNLDTHDWQLESIMDKLKIVDTYKDLLPQKNDGKSFITLQHDIDKDIEAEVERYNYIIDLVKNRGFKFAKRIQHI